MIKYIIAIFIIQMIVSAIYSLRCIEEEIDFFISAKYGENWKVKDVEEKDVEVVTKVYKRAFLPILNTTLKLFVLTDLMVVIVFAIMF